MKFLPYSLFLLSGKLSLYATKTSIAENINQILKEYTQPIVDFIFYPLTISGQSIPLVVLILLIGALFFTIYFKGVNFRYLRTCFKTVAGKYDHISHHIPLDEEIKIKDETIQGAIEIKGKVPGEVSHFQALAASLSATVGLGNIAGVAVAIALGGPGATVWMIIAGVLGMASKFTECTLGVKYRQVDREGKTYGGAMYYLTTGLKELGYAKIGKILAIFFAVMCIGGSFGGGNMFQSNQATAQIIEITNWHSSNNGLIIGLVLALIVGLVIIGGIRRIGAVTEKLVPFMAIVYIAAGLIIVGVNYDMVPFACRQIIDGAINPNAAFGGVVGVLIVGFQRAAFSNEAGVGSSAIAHSAVKTRYPASEGLVALLGPFVDTVIICSMTAVVIVITNAKHNLFSYGNLDASSNVLLNSSNQPIGGVDLTSLAFNSAIPHFSIVLAVAVILFAISTMISWSYYGLQAWKYLFGKGRLSGILYKILFLIFLVIGASSSLEAVIGFSDAMIFAMVFPNMIGLVLLAPKVKKELKKYLNAIKLDKMNLTIDKEHTKEQVVK